MEIVIFACIHNAGRSQRDNIKTQVLSFLTQNL